MTKTSPDPTSLVVSAIAAQVIGGLVTQLSPLMIGGFMDGLSLSERDAGFVISVELFSLAVTAIAIAPVLPRLSYQIVVLVGVTLTLLAQGISIFSPSLALLALFRGLAGVGEGALYAVSLCIVASHCRNPDKVYGYFQMVWALGSVPLFAIGGQLTESFQHRGILALIAGVTLVVAPLLLLLPSDRPEGHGRAVAREAQKSLLLGILTLLAIGLYLTASAAVYAFSTSLGERAGLDQSSVGYALTVTTLVGLAGAGAATALNVRWGRTIPISGFCIAFTLVALALCLSRDPTTFVVALVASGVIFYFSIPYLFGLGAALDHSGRWAAAAGSAYLLGFAAGPLLGGAVIDATGYAGLAVVCVVMTAAAWVLAAIVDRRLSAMAYAAAARAPL